MFLSVVVLTLFRSAVFRRTLWEAVPGGWPVATLLGYEDWAFWIAANKAVQTGIQPVRIPNFLFNYRLKANSMQQNLQAVKARNWSCLCCLGLR